MGGLSCWAVAVGMVISGQYFGWNQGFVYAHLPTMLLALFVVMLFYAGFMRLLLMMSAAMPDAGGIMLYWRQLKRPWLARCVGVAALSEYFFAFTAIAKATAVYCHVVAPALSIEVLSFFILAVFCLINMAGVKQALCVEVVATLLALLGLWMFNVASVYPGEVQQWYAQTTRLSWSGLWLAIPYTLWLFLGIEGIVLSAAEVKVPQRTLPRAVAWAMLVLAVTALMTVVQVGLLLPEPMRSTAQPITVALQHRGHIGHWLLPAVSMLGLCGLCASLNGLLIAASRQVAALWYRQAGIATAAASAEQWRRVFLFLGLLGVVALAFLPAHLLLLCSVLSVLVLYAAGVAAWFACALSGRIRSGIVSWGLALSVSLLGLLAVGSVLTALL